jgi:SAM-dependent methyltransferase
MLVQARSITAASPSLTNIEFRQCGAENIPFLGDGSVDMVVSGQAAHWFDYPTFFPEMRRILRAGGTLALWGYKDHVFVDYPKATDILNKYAYGADSHMLGSYWQQPGRSVVQNKYRDIIPPADEWEAVQRIEYEPRAEGKRSGEGTLFLEMRMRVRDCMNYIRTWSSYHAWKEAHPGMEKKENGGEGDIVDQMFEEIRGAEEGLGGEGWEEKELDMEWGSGLLLARRT